MQPRSVDLSHPTTPTRTVCHSTGNSFNLIQPILSRHIHSLTQHVTFTPFSGFLSLMPLSLAWLHPLILSVRCALRSRAISRLLSHAAPHLAHSHAHAHAKTEMVALPLSLAHLRLPRTNRTDREVHDLWIRRGVEPADHEGEYRQTTHGNVWSPRLQCRLLLLSWPLSRPPSPRSLPHSRNHLLPAFSHQKKFN